MNVKLPSLTIKPPCQPGEMPAAVAAATRTALESGALEPIETAVAIVEDGPVRFAVREVSSLLRKFADQSRAQPGRNPFLPYEKGLWVCDLGAQHVALLNKFPVLESHLLVITRAFEPQEGLLDQGDFNALACAMSGWRCLAFYNAGREAGASQPHRHLQIVPLPLEAAGGVATGTPIDSVLNRARGRSGSDVADLGHAHALQWLPPAASGDAVMLGGSMHAAYRSLLSHLGIEALAETGRQSQPYNLLATHEWMLVVPRSREHFEGISINALSFGGSLFVKDAAQVEIVRRAGPRAMLRAVSARGSSSSR